MFFVSRRVGGEGILGLAVRLMAVLTANRDSYFTANAVRLWLHSSGNGLHKKEVNPHVGTRPGLGVLTLFHKNSTRDFGSTRTSSGRVMQLHPSLSPGKGLAF